MIVSPQSGLITLIVSANVYANRYWTFTCSATPRRCASSSRRSRCRLVVFCPRDAEPRSSAACAFQSWGRCTALTAQLVRKYVVTERHDPCSCPPQSFAVSLISLCRKQNRKQDPTQTWSTGSAVSDNEASTPARCARASLTRSSCATLRRAAFDSFGASDAAASCSAAAPAWQRTRGVKQN